MVAANAEYQVKIMSPNLFIEMVTVAAIVQDCNQENLYLGQIPKCIIAGFVDNEGYMELYMQSLSF